MPFEDDLESIDEGLENTLRKIIHWADQRIGEQLGEVAGVDSLIELREEFEGRIRSYFKEEMRELNQDISIEQCEQLLKNLTSMH